MATVEVRDRAIWTKHIHGDLEIARRLEALDPGATIELRVAGIKGLWEKMRSGPAGAPTPGLKPLGEAKVRWGEMFRSHRGELVELIIEGTTREKRSRSRSSKATSDAEREAAWDAFKALTQAGWRSESGRLDRDQLHER
jgi:hypothetical protein